MKSNSRKLKRYAKVKATTLENNGEDFYSKIGTEGGKNSTSRPFRDPEIAKRANLKSQEARRKKAKLKVLVDK